MVPATMAVVQEQDHALANVDEYANAAAAPVFCQQYFRVDEV